MLLSYSSHQFAASAKFAANAITLGQVRLVHLWKTTAWGLCCERIVRDCQKSSGSKQSAQARDRSPPKRATHGQVGSRRPTHTHSRSDNFTKRITASPVKFINNAHAVSTGVSTSNSAREQADAETERLWQMMCQRTFRNRTPPPRHLMSFPCWRAQWNVPLVQRWSSCGWKLNVYLTSSDGCHVTLKCSVGNAQATKICVNVHCIALTCFFTFPRWWTKKTKSSWLHLETCSKLGESMQSRCVIAVACPFLGGNQSRNRILRNICIFHHFLRALFCCRFVDRRFEGVALLRFPVRPALRPTNTVKRGPLSGWPPI